MVGMEKDDRTAAIDLTALKYRSCDLGRLGVEINRKSFQRRYLERLPVPDINL